MGKIKGKKSLEFLTIMMTVIGTMIGAGIYVKNDNRPQHVLGEMQNPYVALIGWGIIGIVVISAMMVFLEVASSTAEHGNGTVSNWSRLFTSRRWASAVSVYYIVAYLPVNYAFFSTLVIEYILLAATKNDPYAVFNKGTLTAIYLVSGLFFMALFGWMNTFQRNTGKQIEIVGTIVKFIPLILVLIAIFIPTNDYEVMFNHKAAIEGNQPNLDTNGKTWSISMEDISGMRMFSGFTPILFAFNGFIYAANMQKETKNKDVVANGILVGLIFTTIFYILISLALFMGSKDGSIVSFFDYMFSGFKKEALDPSSTGHKAISILFSNIILAVVCIMGLNSYTLTGTNFYNTDANEGIVYSKNKFITQGTSGMVQLILGAICFVILIPLAIYTAPGEKPDPGYYMDMAGNAGTIMGYTAYTIIIIGAMVNRFTGKVKVKKLNNWVFWICSTFGVLSLAAIEVFTYLSFFGAFASIGGDKLEAGTAGAMGVQLGLIVILWIVNEILLWKHPFDRKSVAAQEKKYISKVRAKEKAIAKKQETIKYLEQQKAKVSKEFNTIIKANRKQKAPKADVKLFIELKRERLDEFDKTIKQVKRK